MNRNQLNFGAGSFVGEIMSDHTFFEMEARDQARLLGWADGCPVVEELIDPVRGRGAEAMTERYGEVNFWFGNMVQIIAEADPDLADQLVSPIQRQKGEPVGKHEPESVPGEYYTRMAPMNTLPGYALPRLMITHLDAGDEEERVDRLIIGDDIFREAVHDSSEPMELLAKFSEDLFCISEASPDDILRQVLSPGWLAEHSSQSTIDAFKHAMGRWAPNLAQYYRGLSADYKIEHKLA